MATSHSLWAAHLSPPAALCSALAGPHQAHGLLPSPSYFPQIRTSTLSFCFLSISLSVFSMLSCLPQREFFLHSSQKSFQSPFSFSMPSPSSITKLMGVLEPTHSPVGNQLVYSSYGIRCDSNEHNRKAVTWGNIQRLDFRSNDWESFHVLIILLCCSLSKLKLNLNLLNPTISMWKVSRQCGR